MWCICVQQAFRSAGYIFFGTWFTTYLQEARGVEAVPPRLSHKATLPDEAVESIEPLRVGERHFGPFRWMWDAGTNTIASTHAPERSSSSATIGSSSSAIRMRIE